MTFDTTTSSSWLNWRGVALFHIGLDFHDFRTLSDMEIRRFPQTLKKVEEEEGFCKHTDNGTGQRKVEEEFFFLKVK
jgi:hypothetical protein